MFLVLAATALAAIPMQAAHTLISLVPIDATTVGVVHLDDLRTSPLGSALFSGSDHVTDNGDMTRFLADAGLSPTDDIDTVIVALSPGAEGSGSRALVAAEGRFDRSRLSAAVVKRGAVAKTSSGLTYYLVPESSGEGRSAAVAFVDAGLVIAGDEVSVIQAVADRHAGGSGFAQRSGLGREMVRIPADASSWLLVDVARSERFAARPMVSNPHGMGDALGGALKKVATITFWATDRKTSLDIGGSAVAYDAETRQLLGDTIRGALSTWRLAEADKAPDLVDALRRFNVSENGDSITVSGSIPAAMVKSWGDHAKTTIAASKQAAMKR
jgi:hypothetical protein